MLNIALIAGTGETLYVVITVPVRTILNVLIWTQTISRPLRGVAHNTVAMNVDARQQLQVDFYFGVFPVRTRSARTIYQLVQSS